MSADVDQEIYDDCSSLSTGKPAIQEKPNVKNIAAMFGGKTPPANTNSKPAVAAKSSVGGARPVAVVPPQSGPVPMRTGPKTLPKTNGEVKTNNNNKTQTGPFTPKAGGKIAIPGMPVAFSPSNGSTSPDVKLNDIRSSLKPVGGINTTPKGNTDVSPNSSSTLNSTTTKKSQPTVPPKSPESRSPPKSPGTKSSTSKTDLCILVSEDNCKFRLKPKPKVFGSPPVKPSKLPDVDLTDVKSSIPPALPKRPVPKPMSTSEEDTFDEVYDDVDNVVKSHRPVSEIKEYTEEEEAQDVSGGQVDQETYDDVGLAPPPPARNAGQGKPPTVSVSESETYDDCGVETGAQVEGEMDELYEALDDIQTNANMKEKTEEKRKEQERKEKREREKREKDEKERLKKIEKEKKKEKDLWAKLKINGNEVAVADGRVRENSKGGRLDLAVKKGESVSILRMTDCPQYKWLAKTQEGKVGYVEIVNIEVMTGTLQNIKRDAASGEFEEVYDDVALADAVDQDIYEETS